MKAPLLCGVLFLAAPAWWVAGAEANWRNVAVPGAKEMAQTARSNGIAWYRCAVKLPANWAEKEVTLAVEDLQNTHEAFVNGTRVGSGGRFPPNYQDGSDTAYRYVVPREKVRSGEWNLVAIRVYGQPGRGGFKGVAPQLGTDRQHIKLEGPWQFREGDDPAWAVLSLNSTNAPGNLDEPKQGAAASLIPTFARVEEGTVPLGARGHQMASRGYPLPPAEAARSFTIPDDLEIEQVLAEPIVAQPLSLNFDERGRMWVVQYLQYPAPAGLKVVSKDQWWRAVYDKIPEPPPRGVRGLDKITIHEDTDGDGAFDKHKTFVDGLNIATSCVQGRGGVWVLNPPYLLFYRDADGDDVPDGDPVVHLEGFGLEDTHSVVNSLCWGPDGWLYAAQGSTVTANVRVVAPGSRDTNRIVFSQGQNIWRYHPEKHIYEVFAEGGGNAFSVEFDDKGRVFSGYNGGDARGFHYVQGAYLRKGFEKHGELSNPYAFGYFPAMEGTKGERFSHSLIIYHGGALPARYEGKLFGVEPLQGRVVLSELTPAGSTFKTRDIERVVTSSDSWFRPVDIKAGPDGAIYICDWYDRQVTHTRNQEGNIDTGNGRIYRLRGKQTKRIPSMAAGEQSTPQILRRLLSPNLWERQTALRLAADRRSTELAADMVRSVSMPNHISLESLWALNAAGALDDSLAEILLKSSDEQIRLWTVRLMGDNRSVPPPFAERFAKLAAGDTNIEVRAQLACTAKRLPASEALPIVSNLIAHDEDAKDGRLPLLCWWALESKCETDRDAVLKLFEDSPFWERPMVRQHLLERVMRRFAAAGTRRDLLTCTRLLELSPSREHSLKLMVGFEEAFKGRSLAGLPEEFIAAMARHNVGSDAFRLRQGKREAVAEALRIIGDGTVKKEKRLQFIQILGEVKQPDCVAELLRIVADDSDSALRKAALTALLPYDNLKIGVEVVRRYDSFSNDVRAAAQTLLASRASWSLQLAEAVDAGRVRPADVPPEMVRHIKLYKSPRLAQLAGKHWPETGSATSAEMDKRIHHLAEAVRGGKGDPYKGKKLFASTCASCHTLFNQGGQIGPDLTAYQRGDLENLLLNIVNPSAQIREGYENLLIETTDDRSLNGFLVERDDRTVVLRGIDGQNITLERKQITEMRAAGLSLMPEGLLDAMNDQQVRDLFAYLRSTQPLAN